MLPYLAVYSQQFQPSNLRLIFGGNFSLMLFLLKRDESCLFRGGCNRPISRALKKRSDDGSTTLYHRFFSSSEIGKISKTLPPKTPGFGLVGFFKGFSVTDVSLITIQMVS